MNWLVILLIAACLAITVIPPRWDIAIILKEFQMGHRDRNSFARGLRNAILPSILLWAAIAFVIWLIVR